MNTSPKFPPNRSIVRAKPSNSKRRHRRSLVEVYRRLQPALLSMADYHLGGATCAEAIVGEAFFIILGRPTRPRADESIAHWLFDRVEELVIRCADRLGATSRSRF